MTDLSNVRFNVAIERFASFDEYMEIPGYDCKPEQELTEFQEYQQNLKKRFEACKQRYKGIEEYMEIPDMDIWLKLKNEILTRQICQNDEYYDNDDYDDNDYYYDKEDYHFARFKDKYITDKRDDKFEDKFNYDYDD